DDQGRVEMNLPKSIWKVDLYILRTWGLVAGRMIACSATYNTILLQIHIKFNL
ncbi:hypothetical protein ACJX0J_026749, partial [Zea mays]